MKLMRSGAQGAGHPALLAESASELEITGLGAQTQFLAEA